MKALEEKVLSDPLNQKIFSLADYSGINIYIVGGYIRNLFLGIEKDDRDYVLEGSGAWDFAKKVAGVLKGSFVSLDKERDTARVVIDKRTLDFSGTGGKHIEEDLERRDFTLNSIALSPVKGILDPLNGIEDIKKRLIRAIKKENMLEDPLRLLRAYRIASELKMDIEPETEDIITEYSHLLQNVSGERINYELFLLLKSSESFPYILRSAKSGLLGSIFPELARTKDIPPQGNHHLDAFNHSIEVLKHIEKILKEIPEWVFNYFSEEISFGVTRSSVLKLGGLLHDIGKPFTMKITSKGKYSFEGHERVGSEMIEAISKRLKFSNNTREALKFIVKSHSKPLHLIKDEYLDKRYLYRFYKETDRYLIFLIIISISDIHSMSYKKEVLKEKKERLLNILENYRTFKTREDETPHILIGEEIMEILNLNPGKEVGRIKEILREAQMLGEVRTKEEAIDYIKGISNLT